MVVNNITRGTIIGTDISLAGTFYRRFIGLMAKKKLIKDEGLILRPCNSIHMFFMNFPIDVLFVDKDNKIIYLIQNFNPWRVSKIIKGSKYVVELPSGTINETNTVVGDIIEIKEK